MKTFDKVAWALVAAVGALFLLVGCSGGGTSAETVKVEIPTTKAIAGLVRSTEGVATVIYNNTVVGEKLKLTIEEDREADAAKLVVEVPSKALLGVRGAARRPALEGRASSRPRSGHDGAWPSRASEDRQAESLDGALAILITDSTGNIIFVSVQASVDFSGSKPAVAIVEGGIVTPDSDSDGAPNWLEVHLQTNPNSASDVPTQAAIDGANETLTQGFADAIATGKTTTAGADPQAGASTGEPVTTTPITAATGEPNTTLTAKPGAFSKVNSVSFKFATDTGVKFECSLDGAEFAPCPSPQSYSAIPEGRHTFKVRAVSATGTPDATPASHTWTVDTVIPAASISGLSATPVSSTSVTATLGCSEANCAFLCSLDGSVLAGCNASHLMSGLKDGDHTLKVSAVDEAGNEQADPAVGTFKTDTTKPAAPDAVKVTVAQNAPGSQDQVSGSAGAVEGGAKLKVFEDGLLTALLGEPTAKVDGSFDAINIGDNKGDSLDKVYLIQIDSAGNQSAVLSLANDKTPPGAPTPAASDQTSGSASFTNATTVNMTITGDTGASGWFLTEGTTPAPLATGWAATKPTTFTLSAVEGSHTVKAFIKDAAHNVSASASASISLDTVAPGNPSLTIKDADCPTCSATNAPGVEATIGSDTDAVAWLLSATQATVPGEGDAALTGTEPGSFTLTSGDGSKTVYVWVKDAAGNINAGPVSAVITLDTVAPSGTITAPTNNGFYNSLNATSGTASDVGSGLMKVEITIKRNVDSYYWNGSAWAVSLVWITASGTTSWSYAVLPTWQDGNDYTVQARATDNAGTAQSAAASSAFTFDTTPPAAPTALKLTVTSNPPGTNDTLAGLTGAVGVNETVRVYSNSGLTTLVGTSSAAGADGSFAAFSIGDNQADASNKVYAVAVDQAGNVSASSVWVMNDITGPTSGTITAGNIDTIVNGFTDWVDATKGRLNQPMGITRDSGGNVYFVDLGHHRIRKIDGSGKISTVAGTGVAGYWGDGGPAVSAKLNSPFFVAIDASGNLYISDRGNHRIRKVDPTGTITTVVGTGTGAFGGDGLAATSASINSPTGVAVSSAGHLFLVDELSQRLRMVPASGGTYYGQLMAAGNIYTVAGNGTAGSLGDSGLATSAQLNNPRGVAVDSSGNIYIADTSNNKIRKVNSAGTISTAACTGTAGFLGEGTAATGAQCNSPNGVAVDGAGLLYFADLLNHRIRKVDGSGNISTFAGSGTAGFLDGAAASAQFNHPADVVVDASGNVYITDYNNHRVRKIVSGTVSTIAGRAVSWFVNDAGASTTATLNVPLLLAVDSEGSLYIPDQGNHRIRKVDRTGTITTVAGTGTAGALGDGGPPTSAQLSSPWGVAVSSAGHLYITDSVNNRVRMIPAVGGTFFNVGMVAGNIYSITADLGTRPIGIGIDSGGNVYVSTENHYVKKIAIAGGAVSNVVGTGVTGFSGDGLAATSAQIADPKGLVFDGGDNFTIADYTNHRIRRVTNAGIISTVAGTGTPSSGGDGAAATLADLRNPVGLAMDSSGNVYIGDSVNNAVRKFTIGGNISRVAGNLAVGYDGDGGAAPSAKLNAPYGVAVDASGNVYIADSGNHAIRVVWGATMTGIGVGLGAASTSTTAVTVRLTGVSQAVPLSQASTLEYALSNDNVTYGSYAAYAVQVPWTLTGTPTCTVYVKFKDAAGNLSSAYSDSITYP